MFLGPKVPAKSLLEGKILVEFNAVSQNRLNTIKLHQTFTECVSSQYILMY